MLANNPILGKSLQGIYTCICTLWNHVAAKKVNQYQSIAHSIVANKRVEQI